MNTKEPSKTKRSRGVVRAFLRGFSCPLDFSDPPRDTRKPFTPIRPLPSREAFAVSLRKTYRVFNEGLHSREADNLFQRYNVGHKGI